MIQGRDQKCLTSIDGLINNFQSLPFKYLLESDIQCDLFNRLRVDVNENMSLPSDSNEDYLLDLIYSEYLDRFDLCCLDFEQIKSMDRSQLESLGNIEEYIYHLPVLLAIELKYLKGTYKKSDHFKSFLKDIAKIQDSEFNDRVKSWLCICFIQNEDVLTFQKNKFNNYTFTEIKRISELDSAYVVSPKSVYKLTEM